MLTRDEWLAALTGDITEGPSHLDLAIVRLRDTFKRLMSKG